MSELRKCPFCGGEAKVYDCQVVCRNCWSGSAVEDTTAKAIETWNNRKPLERVIEQIQELANEFQEGFYHEVHCKNREDNCEWKDCCSCALERAIEIIKEEMM